MLRFLAFAASFDILLHTSVPSTRLLWLSFEASDAAFQRKAFALQTDL
jgi:hypothetical protein